MKKSIFFTVISVALIAVCVSCGGDDDQSSSPSVENLTGTWICYQQIWHEKGETESSSYTGNNYYIVFNKDNTGSINSGSEELMEVRGSRSFKYTLSGNKIVSSLYEETIWTIVALSDKQLTLRWVDGNFWIECKFRKYQDDTSNH